MLLNYGWLLSLGNFCMKEFILSKMKVKKIVMRDYCRIAILIGFIVVGSPFLASISYAENLLTNSGFESGDKTGWIGNYADSSGEVTSLNPRSETYSLQVTGNSDTWVSVSQTISVTEGLTYEISGWLKIENITTGHYNVHLLWYDINGEKILGTSGGWGGAWVGSKNENTEYAKLYRSFIAPAGAVTAKLFLQGSKADGTGYFDDVQMRLVTIETIAAGNLLTNWGFESGDQQGWTDNGANANVSLNSLSQTYALQITGDPNRWLKVIQEVSVIEGLTYEVSLWLKIENITIGRYIARIHWYDANSEEIVDTPKWVGSKNINTNGYVNISNSFVAPAGAVTATFILQASKADGSGYYDDLKIKQIPGAIAYTVDFNAAPGAYVTKEYSDTKLVAGYYYREFPTLNDNGDVGGAVLGNSYEHDAGYSVQAIHGAMWSTNQNGERLLNDLGLPFPVNPTTGACSSSWSECRVFVLGLTNSQLIAAGGNYDTYNWRALRWDADGGWWPTSIGSGWLSSDHSVATDVNQSGVFVGMSRHQGTFYGYIPRAFVNSYVFPIEYTPSYSYATSESFFDWPTGEKVFVAGSARFGNSSQSNAFLAFFTLNYPNDPYINALGTLSANSDGSSEAYDVVAKTDYYYGTNFTGNSTDPLTVGQSTVDNNDVHAFLFLASPPAGMHDLGVLDGGDKSVARSINLSGQIVGYANNVNNELRAALFTYNQTVIRPNSEVFFFDSYQDPSIWKPLVASIFNEKVFDLNALVSMPEGWVLVDAYKVNNNSQILARATGPNNENQYVILNPIDSDADGIGDFHDNCTLVYNPEQRDSNGDGYGNICDPDLNNDGVINLADQNILDAFMPGWSWADTDFNGDIYTGFEDYLIMEAMMFKSPGPSYIDRK